MLTTASERFSALYGTDPNVSTTATYYVALSPPLLSPKSIPFCSKLDEH